MTSLIMSTLIPPPAAKEIPLGCSGVGFLVIGTARKPGLAGAARARAAKEAIAAKENCIVERRSVRVSVREGRRPDERISRVEDRLYLSIERFPKIDCISRVSSALEP